MRRRADHSAIARKVESAPAGRCCGPGAGAYTPPPVAEGAGTLARVRLPKGYKPSEDEPFMNARQREYFRRRLLAWRDDLLRETSTTLQHLQEERARAADVADRASMESERSVELRTRDRGRKLIAKIDQALKMIEDGTYGYCTETAEPIGVKRLVARPIATLSLEAQERHERRERVFRDD